MREGNTKITHIANVFQVFAMPQNIQNDNMFDKKCSRELAKWTIRVAIQYIVYTIYYIYTYILERCIVQYAC